MVNPIVTFIFFISLSFSIILCSSWIGFGIYLYICCALLLFNSKYIKSAIKQVKPFFLFLPLFISLYILISFLFTDTTWEAVLSEAGYAISKLLLLVIIMSLYLEVSRQQNLISALRSIWSKLNLNWRWVEDLFIFLELSLRFYPTFQQEWQSINLSKQALGIDISASKWKKIKSTANDLPGMILQSYRKAENTATIMLQRGYGNQIPRGVANPIFFRFSDFTLLILIFIGHSLLKQYVTL